VDYQAEVPVSLRLEQETFILDIAGRIDGVLHQPDQVLVEEIKSTRRPLREIREAPSEMHWGQVQCYAYLYARQTGIDRVDARLTYVQLDNGRTLELERQLDVADLGAFFDDLLQRYLIWIRRLAHWAAVRDASIARLDFPFAAYRNGQRNLAVAVFRTVRDGGPLLVQAATGIGKTMAVLYPAVKALGEGHVPKVVFLTARTTGRLAAQAALIQLAQAGLRFKWVSLTAKEKICLAENKKQCAPEACEYARGHFDRLNDALAAAFVHDALDRETIERLARQHRVCPFELSLELVNWADGVIGDYNYAFDPHVRLQRLFGEGAGRPAVLVDEAHNLVDRAREMFSATLTKQPLLPLRRRLKPDLPRLSAALGRINAWLAALRRTCRSAGGDCIETQLPEELVSRLRHFTVQAETWLRLNLQTDYREALLQFFFEAVRFQRVAEMFGPAHAVIAAASGEDVRLKLFCIDPADLLAQCWQSYRAAVLFSATLAPADYFASVFGLGPDARRLSLTSPFDPSHLAVFSADRIATRYTRREATCEQVSGIIADLVRQRQGHYLIFFPSHAYLAMVRTRFCQDHPELATLTQTPEMSETEREAFIARFTQKVDGTLIGFAVLGGVFGEGIDLRGEYLTGAVIVGVGLPGIGPERDLIRDYYNRQDGRGYAFAYEYPGITRVLQAAGRVIRSETDQGVVLLIDDRYSRQRYRSLLPDTWQVQPVGDTRALRQRLTNFWGETQ
ncbi:MAG: ATP-dependent DNA helicase, partial [Desulfatitalea sp.]|nr:PD-(D/E)XK nuclease family protein [Desulfatitalea sp.]NNK02688.1 ATP-dependent DNA helicase [Desulfatitalea sp.]